MDDKQTKDRVISKTFSGSEKVDGSVDHSISKNTSKSPSDTETDLNQSQDGQQMDAETQSRLKAFLEVAGVKLSHVDARTFQDPEILRKLTNRKPLLNKNQGELEEQTAKPSMLQSENLKSVSNALDEAATALNRMRCKQQVGSATPVDEDSQKTGTQLVENNSIPTTTIVNNSSAYQQPVAAAAAPVPKPDKSSMIRQNKQQQQQLSKHHQQQQQQQQQQLHDVADLQALQHLLGQAGHSNHSEDGENLLSLASSSGYFELAEVLLRMRASIEDKSTNTAACFKGDSTPLMEAASGGYADIVKLLIDHGANVNATSSVGNTALTYACCGGFEDVVKILLDRGAEVEHQNENGHTPLMEAASCGHVGVAKLLLDHGANINTHSNEFKESALTLACYKGHLGMVKFLLGAGADQDHKTDEMHTALMEACMDGHVEVARLLLDHGAQVNMPAESFESPLTLAACGGHFELAALLLSRGADLEEMNDEGYTPLMEAAREGHEDVVQLLVDHGANINAQTEETQETALTLACCGGFLEVAQYLVDHGAEIELGASTPLMEAAQEGHIDIVKYLIGKGANIHAVTNTMDTCLTYAAANGHTAIVKLLLQCGAEMEHESEGGRTPLMKAARAGHMETVQFLISQGGDSNRITMNNDHTVLSLACAGGHIGIVKYLLVQGADSGHVLKDNSTMLIEAARGGHSAVVGLLLQQPKFTAALKNQIAQHQQMQSRSADQASGSIAGKRRARGSHLGAGGRGKKQQKSPVTQRKEESTSTKTSLGREEKDLPNNDGGSSVLVNGHPMHQPQPPLQPPILRRHITADLDMTPPKRSSNTSKDHVDPSSGRPPLHPEELNQKFTGSVTLNTGDDKLFEPSKFTVNPSYEFGNPTSVCVPSAVNPEAFFPLNVPTVPIQGGAFSTASTSSSDGNYLLPPLFAQSPVYSNQEHMEAYMKADEILRNHMMQLDYNKQQALMTALESLMQQSEAHRASIGIGGYEVSADTPSTTTSGRPVVKSTSSSSEPPSSNINLSVSPFKPPTGACSPNIKTDPCSESVTSTEPTTTTSSAPQWSFTDPSRMPQFSMGISTLAPSTNSPEKQSPKSSHHPSPGKHLSHGDKQAFASRIASRLEQVKRSPSTNTPSTLPDYYNTSGATPVTQFFNTIEGQQPHHPSPSSTFHPPLVYNGSPSKFNFGSSSEQQHQTVSSSQGRSDTGSSSFSKSGPCSPRYEREGSPATSSQTIVTTPSNPSLSIVNQSSPSVNQPPVVTPIANPSSSGISTDLSQLPPVPLPNPQYLQPIYSPDLVSLKHFTHRSIPPSSISIPDIATAQHFDANGKPIPLTSSVWLDANFPLDIPPPSDLIPEHLHHMIPSGYKGHLLETESIPSSGDEEINEEDEEDEELEDALALHPDLSNLPPGSYEPAIDIDQQTDSNHDTALTLAAAGGHDDLVELLLERGADIEHKDKKGCTPIILAANAGHAMTVAILLEHNADLEAQTDRTKDTALSLACSSGRQEVVELLLAKGSNYEHRNVSDYTPLSLAASGGYVAIIKMLLKAGADINSRTGSKLGISPLMLAAMNGHTTTVKLLLDFGSDINAQIETNRNTALTLACFQGRHEVVNLLVERQANVEHRAKTGLTPLMEAASGGYHEVGLVLINKGADVNAAPVPSSRDTALTIAADKGHYKFVDLLLHCGAMVDVRNKKGNSPLWLAANGGHLDVTRLLIDHKADVDSQDNRKVSCLMAAFRKGHYKVVRYLVEFVSQFPSDADLNRYINTLSDKELIKKCQRCMEVIIHAKERQAAEANKNASILLQELDQERQHEENRKAAIARKRARKKKQKEKKKAQEKESKTSVTGKDISEDITHEHNTSDKENKRHDDSPQEETASSSGSGEGNNNGGQDKDKGRDSPMIASRVSDTTHKTTVASIDVTHTKASPSSEVVASKGISTSTTTTTTACSTSASTTVTRVTTTTTSVYPSTRSSGPVPAGLLTTPSSSPRRGKKDEGWKEVGKRTKKISIPASKVGQVVGRNSSNLSLIKLYTGANIEIEKSSRQAPNRTLIVKGSHESIRQSQQCITALQRDPNCDLLQLLQVKMNATSAIRPSPDILQPTTTVDSSDSLSSWKAHLSGGKPVTTSSLTSTKSKLHTSQSAPDTTASVSHAGPTTIHNTTSTTSTTTSVSGASSKQVSGALKTSRSITAIEKKVSGVPLDNHITRMSTTTVSATVSFTTNTVHHSMVSTTTANNINNSAKSGAVRQLFTSNASSHQVTNTNSVTGIKMSTSLSLHSSNKPGSHPGSSGMVGNNISTSSSWKQVVTSSAPSHLHQSTSLNKLTNEDSKHTGPSNTRQTTAAGRTQGSASSKSFHGPPNTTTSAASSKENTQNVFEQILKTPSLFPEVTSQITQPKKYSDAVGKKQSDQQHAVKVAATPVTTSNHVTLINRAPGSKVIGIDQQAKSSSVQYPPVLHDSGTSQQHRTSPWHEDMTSDEYNVSGDNISPGSSLGPIAPPTRSSKPSTSISPKNQSIPSPQRPLQTPPVSKSPLLGPAPPGLLPLPDKTPIHVFRPIHPEGSELPNIVPTQIPTPVRNSRPPLLATPPGFPSQLMQTKARSEAGKRSPLPKRVQHHVNPNSPFQGVVISDNTASDNRSPTKSPSQQQQQQQQQCLGQILALTNNKTSSNFNPNAPSFVPMGMPPQIAQTTSSILGNPPSNLKYSLPVVPPPPISSSILGTAPPQLQTSMAGTPGPVVVSSSSSSGGSSGSSTNSSNTGSSTAGPPPPTANNPQTMTPPIVIPNPAPPAPPPPAPPPPPVITPLMNAQPSILGNPPFPLLVPQPPPSGQQSVPPSQQPPQSNRPVYRGNQYDTPSTIPPQPQTMIQTVPSQFTSHPNLQPFMNPCDMISDQFTGSGLSSGSDNPQVFGFSSGSFTMDTTIPTATRMSGDGDPNGIPSWNHQFGGLTPPSVSLDDLGDADHTDQLMFPPHHPMIKGVDSSDSTYTGQLQTLIPPPPSMTSKDGSLPHALDDATQSRSGLSAFSVLPPGIGSKSSLWTFTPPNLGVSEDSGWSKPMEGISTSLLNFRSSDWPVMTSSMPTSSSTSGDLSDGMTTAILPQDNLQTVLDKLGLGDYYHIFQENYIDRHALMLMSEKDFTEVGVPKGPRIKLLNALGRYTVGQNLINEDDHGYNRDEDTVPSQPSSSGASVLPQSSDTSSTVGTVAPSSG